MSPTEKQVQHIDQVRAVLDPGSRLHLLPVTEDFYESLGVFGDFMGHTLVQQFEFAEPWPTWEVHPEGDELVFLLTGDTDLVLAGDQGEETVLRVSEPGQYVVVPKGTWHTARPHAPTTLLFVTPGAGTLNALTPGGEPV